STQDVNGQYLYDVRKLGDDRALRSSLLKQLAKATTTQQIDSLTAQIHDAEASIRSDESTLRNLNHQIGFSQIDVSINAVQLPVVAWRGEGGARPRCGGRGSPPLRRWRGCVPRGR